MLKFVACLIFFLFAVAFAIPQACTKVSNEIYDRSGINGSATFSLSDDSNFLLLSDVTVKYDRDEGEPKNYSRKLCIRTSENLLNCISDVSKPLKLPVNNSTLTLVFRLVAIFNHSGETSEYDEEYEFDLFSGIFDEGSFTFSSGAMFNEDNKCGGDASYDRHGKLTYFYKGCCETLKPTYSSSQNAPLCKEFKNRATIYNVDDNYSIFATIQSNYTLIETLIGYNMSVKYQTMTPANFSIYPIFNNLGACSSDSCTYGIYKYDTKFLISAEFDNHTISLYFDDVIPMVLTGRIIFRNNQTLMSEGVPFTKENNCQYYNLGYTLNKVVSTSLCCTQFF